MAKSCHEYLQTRQRCVRPSADAVATRSICVVVDEDPDFLTHLVARAATATMHLTTLPKHQRECLHVPSPYSFTARACEIPPTGLRLPKTEVKGDESSSVFRFRNLPCHDDNGRRIMWRDDLPLGR